MAGIPFALQASMTPLERTILPGLLALPMLCVAGWLHARSVSAWTASLLDAGTRTATARPSKSAPENSRDPFASDGKALRTESASPQPDPPRQPRWADCPNTFRVVAIAASEPDDSLALLRSATPGPGQPSILRRVGDEFAHGRVVGITSDRVYLDRPEGPCQVRMDTPEVAVPARVPARQEEVAGIRRVTDGEYEVDHSLVEKVLVNPRELSHVRAVPDVVDGKSAGIRLLGIRNGDALSALGLRNGDRIESVNGYDMSDPEAMLTAYARLRTAKAFSLRVNRGGAPVQLDVKITSWQAPL